MGLPIVTVQTLQTKTPNCLDVILIPKNAEGLPCHCTCRYVHDARDELASNFVPEFNVMRTSACGFV